MSFCFLCGLCLLCLKVTSDEELPENRPMWTRFMCVGVGGRDRHLHITNSLKDKDVQETSLRSSQKN